MEQSHKGKKNGHTKKTSKAKGAVRKKTSRNSNFVKPVEMEHGGRPNSMKVAKERISSKRWTDDDTNILIDMMEERPCLWDVNCKDYKSRDERNKALNEIEDVIPPNEIMTKIISLRSQLGREMRKTVKTKSGQSADDLYKSNWAYWDRLQFLQPVMKPGKSRDTFDTCNDDSEQEGRNSPDPDPQISVHPTPKISKKAYNTKKSELLSTCIRYQCIEGTCKQASRERAVPLFHAHCTKIGSV
eukprot:Seg832.1 transcript_id=Seg832.1/GoldUCD/mRNA.D3Y31 product="hypothetical protein" protein_id=Seg832.1/GoldUCD/D3Y31